jgi:hypothetical protein
MSGPAFAALLNAIAAAAGFGPVVDALAKMVAAFRQDRAFTAEQDAALDRQMEASFASPAWQPDPK